MTKIEQFIVHHSGGPRHQTVEQIRAFHVAAKPEGRGFDDIAYHYIIDGDARLHIGRALPTTGAHAPPNSTRIGVCVIGDNTIHDSRWTNDQRQALMTLWRAIKLLWPGIELHGHRDVMPGHTECPAVDVRALLMEA